jgi:hypothetical protein
MNSNAKVALEILDEIERARSGALPLEELESRVWRLLERTDPAFPRILAGRLEGFVQELRRLEEENVRLAAGRDPDPARGADQLYNEITGELGRYLR